ncbi:hypothetical protein E1200_32670 [Actinomadura sp. GC306]|uniref:hypothetical protein n=1 Tax=Actinomadura sp. GC306 TaxID=2530367 RepID=UPI0010486D25|nr:hypothetical protein [Actinomadura sp. GC306]TDC58980.1 hypothetical protein E1200_32670 [Actinomadura sp. GC306]
MAERDELLKARIYELLESWQPWQRRLWDLGTVLALREAAEAADWVSRQVLSQTATSWYARESLLPRLGSDAAVRDGQVRRHLNEVCRRPLKAGTRGQRSLTLLADLVEDGYLRRWHTLISSGGPYDVERAARYITSHMLDQGFHQDHLRRQVKGRLDAAARASDLIELFIELQAQGNNRFSGFVVLEGKIPAGDIAAKSAHWLDQKTVSALLAEGFPSHPTLRGSGGFRFRVEARDPYMAVVEMTEIFDRLRNRARYLRGRQQLAAHPVLFVEGMAQPQEFQRGDPSVTVHSLAKAGVLYDGLTAMEDGSRLDDALELAAPLTGSSPSTAVAGAWAALESLLFCDTDEADREEGRAVAADRAAALVAAGWCRAELTALSHRAEIVHADARLRAELERAGKVNRARVEVLLRWLRSGAAPPALAPADLAALNRMRGLTERPHATLGRVNGYLRGALRRLYRQRNIVLHGGSTRSVALRASLRTAGPLVGAALDRIAHGYASCDVSALHLASRAQLALRVVEDPDGWPLEELLEV